MICYGPVIVTAGKHKGRIGYYDDNDGKKAIVYWGGFPFSSNYDFINFKFLSDDINTNDLVSRLNSISDKLYGVNYGRQPCDTRIQIELLAEYIFVNGLLEERYNHARAPHNDGKTVFLSHSSKDKPFVRTLATDLSSAGFCPWLDEWQIKVGENIPRKISAALQQCDYFIIVLSKNSTASKWVEEEFFAAYNGIFNNPSKVILPALLEPCEIPYILSPYKYADFSDSYDRGLADLLDALQ